MSAADATPPAAPAAPLSPREVLAALGYELGPMRPFPRSHHPAPPGHVSVAMTIFPELLTPDETGATTKRYRMLVLNAPQGREASAFDARIAELLAGHARYLAESVAWLEKIPAEERAGDHEAQVAEGEAAVALVGELLARMVPAAEPEPADVGAPKAGG